MARGQLVQFGFHGGIDEKTDPKQAQPGQLTSLVNMRQTKTGLLARRPGHTALTKTTTAGTPSSPVTLSACTRLMVSKNELLLSDGSSLYGYSSALTKWVKHDDLPRCIPRWSMVQQSPSDFGDVQIAVGNGLTIFAWTQTAAYGTPGDIYAMVQDTTTGAVMLPSTLVSNGSATAQMARLAVCGTVATLMWSDSAGKLIASLLDLTAPSGGFGSRVTVKTDQNTLTPFYDMIETTGSAFVAVYSDTTTTPLLKSFRATVTLPATITVSATVSSGDTNGLYTSVCCTYDSAHDLVYVLYGASTPYPTPTTFHVRAYTCTGATCAVSSAPFTITTPTSQIVQSGVTFVAATSYVTGVYQTANGDGKAVELGHNTTLGNIPSMLATSRPFAYGSDAYAIFAWANTHYLCKIVGSLGGTANPLQPVATIAPRIAFPNDSIGSDGLGSLDQSPTRVYNVGGNRWRAFGTVIADANSQARVCITCIDLLMGDAWIANNDPFPAQHQQPVEFGELLHMSGGVPSSFDGQIVSEMGFLHGALDTKITLTPATSGGGLGQGTYQYRICYEWTDNRGQVYRSLPSIAKSVTTTGTGSVNKVTLTIPNLLLTTKSGIQIIVYRTPVDGTGDLFYRQTPYSVPAGNINNPSTATTTIVDTTGDATIQSQALLYTNGGTLDSECPSALGCLIKHQRRLAGIGDDGRTVWLSNEYVDREAPRWNDEWQMQFDEPLTALASLDDKLVAFSERSIWFVTGEGPTDTGASNDWTVPQRIQSETGCIDPRGVFNTSEGVIFQGRRGLYMLDRALNVAFVGALVEDTTAANPLAVESLGQVSGETSCFLSFVPSSGSSTGIRLHWDTYYRMWTEDKLVDGSTTASAVAGLVNWNGAVMWATPGGQVYQQSSSVWTDGGTWFDSSFITGFIAAAGPLGFERVRKLQTNVTWATNHDVKMSIAFDGSSTYAQSFQFTADKVSLQGGCIQMRIGAQNGANPRCESIRIKYEILTPTSGSISTGQAATLTGIGMDIVPKSGQKRLGSTVQV